MAQRTEKKLYFLLMGKIGHGKSSTDNTILQRKSFRTSCNMMSETKEVEDGYVRFEKLTLKVIDGPGLEDSQLEKLKEKEDAVKNMIIALGKCSEGVDAFLLVLKFGCKFSNDDKSALDSLKRIFGETFFHNVIVVFTCGDHFLEAMEDDNCNLSFEEWCREQTGPVKELYEQCNGRFVLFNNREKNEGKNKEQIRQIIRLTETLQTDHGRYTSACFEQAQEEREKLILEHKAPQLREEFQEKIALLTADIDLYAKQPSDKLKEEIERKTRDLKIEIELHDKGHGILNDMKKLLEKVTTNLDDTAELQNINKKLVKLRKSNLVWNTIGVVVAVVGGVIRFVPLPFVLPIGIGTVVVGGVVSAISTGYYFWKEDKLNERKKNLEDNKKF